MFLEAWHYILRRLGEDLQEFSIDSVPKLYLSLKYILLAPMPVGFMY
jgi:hypothetical protein